MTEPWAVGGGAETAEQLVAELRTVRVQHAAWQQQLRGGHAPKQRAVLNLEAATALKQSFVTEVVPGLLQTAEYARHIFAALAVLQGVPDDVEEAVRVRLRRQEVLYDPSKHFRFLLAESALHNQVSPPAVHRAQLDRLLLLSGLDNVEFAVLPFTARLPVLTHHGFSIHDDRLVLVETFTAELQLRDADDVALYGRIFELLWAVSNVEGQAAEQIRAVLAG